MTDKGPVRVVAITAHARAVGAAERERLAVDLRASVPPGSVVLATCHRVEAYLAGARAAVPSGIAAIPDGARVLAGEAAVRHLVAVAAGRDSVVVGEDEILHQLRQALEAQRQATGLDPVVDRLFAIALRAGRTARSWQQGPRRSLGDVAIDAIRRHSGPLAGRPVLVVGAGKMGSIAARCAVRAGADVVVANRSRARADALAATVGGRATDLDPGRSIASAAGVIVALGGPWRLAEATVDALAGAGSVVVDLSFPPAVPPAVADRLGDRLVTTDSLATAADHGTPGDDRAAAANGAGRSDALVERAVAEFADWTARSDSRAAAQALIRRADAEREQELEALWRRIPELDPEARAAIEGMTRHLAARLLQAPLERLGRDPDGSDGRVVREIFAL